MKAFMFEYNYPYGGGVIVVLADSLDEATAMLKAETDPEDLDRWKYTKEVPLERGVLVQSFYQE